MAPFTQEHRPRADGKGIRKLKCFFAARVTVNSVKREAQEGRVPLPVVQRVNLQEELQKKKIQSEQADAHPFK